ncbi:hypothetical protein AX16_000654 [Volvariella volvacea WC 439]|nr:hypothetical protein AX16_000654 [Volvariella volvacea WC 439]
MRFHTPLVLLPCVASLVSATLFARQDTGGETEVPDCVVPCVGSVQFPECDPDDSLCICSDTEFINALATCIQGACTGDDLPLALSGLQAECASVGIDVGVGEATPSPSDPTDDADPSGSESDSATPTDDDSEPTGSDTSATSGSSTPANTGTPPSNTGTPGTGTGSGTGSGSGSSNSEDDNADSGNNNGAIQVASGFAGLAVALVAGVVNI